MSIEDVVVDTNVLMHASNPNEKRHQDSVEFVENLLESDTKLCIDEGFDLDETANRSLIGQEYLKHLVFGQVGAALLVSLAQSQRLSFVPCAVSGQARNLIDQAVKKPRDRTFVRVAVNSTENTLVTHDFEDFPVKIRKLFGKKIGVTLCTAEVGNAKITAS